MIQRDLILTVNNTTASLNEPLVIYQHDRGITLKIKVMKYKFAFNRIVEEDVVVDSAIISARAIVVKPDGKTWLECPRQAVVDDCVIIPIVLDWTDEYSEIGKYQLQLQLYGSDYINERVTLPPVEFTVAKPIGYPKEDGVEFNPLVDQALADASVLTDELSGVEIEDGNLALGIYEKIEWETGDVITSDGLNKFEDALEYLVRTQKAKAVFTPSISKNGDLSWTNDLALENPETVNIRGPKGEKGEKGDTGPKGADGTMTFEDLTDEQRESLRGPKGEQGEQGIQGEIGPVGPEGPRGQDGTVSFDELTDSQRESLRGPQGEIGPQGPQGKALTYDDLTVPQKMDLTQGFITCTSNITRIEVVTKYPDVEEEGVLYIRVSDLQ